MGEPPIFKIQAHVFQIDPETKKKWIPVSNQAVDICFYHDNVHQVYRIISVDGQRALINSTLTENMLFNKTSPKFGQWSDQRANTVYGLGFSNEESLQKFVDQFNKIIQELLNTKSLDDKCNNDILLKNSKTDFSDNKRLSGQTIESLKYENDRLKLALATSSSNAKKWETELQTLKNNNAKLTTALQESNTNVEEWKKQLLAYKDENNRMKKLQNGSSVDIQKELLQCKDNLAESERTNKKQQQELSDLQIRFQGLQMNTNDNKKYTEKIKNLEQQIETYKMQISDLKTQLNESRMFNSQIKTRFSTLQEQFRSKLHELSQLNDKLFLD